MDEEGASNRYEELQSRISALKQRQKATSLAGAAGEHSRQRRAPQGPLPCCAFAMRCSLMIRFCRHQDAESGDVRRRFGPSESSRLRQSSTSALKSTFYQWSGAIKWNRHAVASHPNYALAASGGAGQHSCPW
eukprot:1430259-Rhodomonas_salina.1